MVVRSPRQPLWPAEPAAHRALPAGRRWRTDLAIKFSAASSTAGLRMLVLAVALELLALIFYWRADPAPLLAQTVQIIPVALYWFWLARARRVALGKKYVHQPRDS